MLLNDFKTSISKDLKALPVDSSAFVVQVKNHMFSLVEETALDPLRSMLLENLSVPGKQLRSQICFQLGTSLNLDFKDLTKLALSCELLHEASLIHDDLQDGDLVRRNQKSFWARFGKEQAINAGDFLLSLSHLPLEESPLSVRRLHTKTLLKLVNGQAKEIDLRDFQSTDKILEKYLDCTKLKTGMLFSYIAEGLGLFKAVSDYKIKKLSRLYQEIGVLFQMQDDVLDLYGDKLRGDQGNDLKEGKVSFLIAHHLNKFPQNLNFIKDTLNKGRQNFSVEDVHAFAQKFQEDGTLQSCLFDLQLKAKKILSLTDEVALKEQSHFSHEIIKKILKPIEPLL